MQILKFIQQNFDMNTIEKIAKFLINENIQIIFI